MDRPSQRLIVDHFEPLQVLGFLVRIENLLLVTPFIIFWSFLLITHFAVGDMAAYYVIVRAVLGIFLTIATFSCYLMIVLDYTARGFQKPPKISGDLFDRYKGKFFKAVLALSLFLSCSLSVGEEYGFTLFLILGALFLPVVIAIISIRNSFSSAMNPVNWVKFFFAVKFDRTTLQYLVCLALIYFVSDWLLSSDHLMVAVPFVSIMTILFLALFRIVGIIIHSNAESLGLSVRYGPQVEESQIIENRRRDESDFCAHLYRLVQADKTQSAWQDLQDYLNQADPQALTRLWPVMKQWSNPTLSLLAGQRYIEELCNVVQFTSAWQVLAYCYEANQKEFRLLTAESTFKLCASAETSTQRKLAAELLRYFPKDFPNHPRSAEAMLDAAELLLRDDSNPGDAHRQSKKLLQQIRIKYPDLKRNTRYLRLCDLADIAE